MKKENPKKKGKKGRTHITFVFENHTGAHAEKVRRMAKDYDALLIELDDRILGNIKKLIKTKPMEEIEKMVKNDRYTIEKIKMIKNAIESGKEVYAIDKYVDLELSETPWYLTTIPREFGIIERIHEIMPKLEGKRVLINLGAAHTFTYHSIKKMLEPEIKNGKVHIERVMLTMKNGRTTYNPDAAFRRYLLHKSPEGSKIETMDLIYNAFNRWYTDEVKAVEKKLKMEYPEMSRGERLEKAWEEVDKDLPKIWVGFNRDKEKFVDAIEFSIDTLKEARRRSNFNPTNLNESIQLMVLSALKDYIKKWKNEESLKDKELKQA